MKSSYFVIIYLFLLGFCLLLCGCGTDSPEAIANTATSDGGGPITHNLDTAVGYCFQMAVNGVEESVEVEIHGNKIRGEGLRLHLGTQKAYQLFIEGVIDGEDAAMSISASNTRKSEDAYQHVEIWRLGEQDLLVKNRNIEGFEGEFKFYRTNCVRHKNTDSTRYDFFGGFYEGYAVVGKNGMYGLVNENWDVTIPLIYRDLGVVNEGSIVFYDEQKGRSGLLDVNGNILVEAEYAEIHCFNEGLAAFLSEEGKWGFMNRDLEVVIPAKFFGVNFFKPDPTRHPFNEGLANVRISDNQWIFINNKGETIIGGNFLHAESFVGGKAKVFKDNKWFVIDKSGACIENCDE